MAERRAREIVEWIVPCMTCGKEISLHYEPSRPTGKRRCHDCHAADSRSRMLRKHGWIVGCEVQGFEGDGTDITSLVLSKGDLCWELSICGCDGDRYMVACPVACPGRED